jgi:hypothetical protein
VRNRLEVKLKTATSATSTTRVAIAGLPLWRATKVRTEAMVVDS